MPVTWRQHISKGISNSHVVNLIKVISIYWVPGNLSPYSANRYRPLIHEYIPSSAVVTFQITIPLSALLMYLSFPSGIKELKSIGRVSLYHRISSNPTQCDVHVKCTGRPGMRTCSSLYGPVMRDNS